MTTTIHDELTSQHRCTYCHEKIALADGLNNNYPYLVCRVCGRKERENYQLLKLRGLQRYSIKQAIKKWYGIKRGEVEDRAAENCTCCEFFIEELEVWVGDGQYEEKELLRHGCENCPVYEKTGVAGCRETPYEEWLNHHGDCHYLFISPNKIVLEIKCEECRNIVTREIEFLETTLCGLDKEIEDLLGRLEIRGVTMNNKLSLMFENSQIAGEVLALTGMLINELEQNCPEALQRQRIAELANEYHSKLEKIRANNLKMQKDGE